MNKAVFASIGAAVALVSVTAAADPAFTANKPQVGIDLGYGIYTGDGSGEEESNNPYGLGFGARGGYTLDFGLYVGAAFHYYLGFSEELTIPFMAGTIEASGNIYQFGAELGYDLGLGPQFVLRPKVGIGYGILASKSSFEGEEQSGSEGGLAFTPGLQGLYSLGQAFLLLGITGS
jgi:hypothetical protein